MTDADRIRLAELVGGPIWEAYINPGKHPESVELPDPENNANDCEALIRWLNEQGYNVDLSIRKNGKHSARITIGHEPVYSDGDDWKQGVCELALKVIDEQA